MLSMSACLSIPKTLKKSFTYCYDGKYTGIDTLINIDGYFEEMVEYPNHPYLEDTCYHYFMFYNNGLFVYNIRDIYYDDSKKEWVKKDVPLFLKDFSENSEAPGANYFYGNFWGSYIIDSDTIKIQKFYKAGSFNDSWHGREEWYRIIDKNTILRINSFNMPKALYSQPSYQPVYMIQHPAIFVSLAKPKSDKSWILKEKWFWCNERDWKDYMERIKQKKRK